MVSRQWTTTPVQVTSPSRAPREPWSVTRGWTGAGCSPEAGSLRFGMGRGLELKVVCSNFLTSPEGKRVCLTSQVHYRKLLQLEWTCYSPRAASQHALQKVHPWINRDARRSYGHNSWESNWVVDNAHNWFLLSLCRWYKVKRSSSSACPRTLQPRYNQVIFQANSSYDSKNRGF